MAGTHHYYPTPMRRVRTSVAAVSATFAAGTPHPSLRGVVLRYEGYAERTAGPVTFRELPCTFVPIIIDLDAGWTVAHRQHAARRCDSGRSSRASPTGRCWWATAGRRVACRST